MELNSKIFFNQNKRLFYCLKCNYWSTDNQITKSFNDNMKKCIDLINNTIDEIEIQKILSLKETLRYSYDILTDQNKERYMHFLLINYILSQPNTYEKLKTNFKNFVFPFYIFLNKLENSSLSADYFQINFIKCSINFYFKSKLVRGIMGDTIKLIIIDKEFLKLILKNTNEEIYFSCTIQQQKEYVYLLLLYLKQIGEQLAKDRNKEKNLNITYTNKNSSKENEHLMKMLEDSKKIKSFKLLQSDLYIPSGIILRAIIKKEHKKKSLMNSNRFMVLGNSTIIIFKDEKMSEICNVIPIINFNVIFLFKDHSLSMKILFADRKYKMWFRSVDEFEIWKSTILEIAENNLKEKIEDKMVSELLKENEFINLFKINETNDHLKEFNELLEKRVGSLNEKLRLSIEIKEKITVDIESTKYEKIQHIVEIEKLENIKASSFKSYNEINNEKFLRKISLNSNKSSNIP